MADLLYLGWFVGVVVGLAYVVPLGKWAARGFWAVWLVAFVVLIFAVPPVDGGGSGYDPEDIPPGISGQP